MFRRTRNKKYVSNPTWYSKLKKDFDNQFDKNFNFVWIPFESKIILHTDRLSQEGLTMFNDFCSNRISQNVKIEKFNHNMEILWRDINKYAKCVTANDMLLVNPDYKNDLTSDGTWIYYVPKLATNTAFRSAINMTAFLVDIPSVTDATQFFSGCNKLKRVEMDTSHLTVVTRMFENCAFDDIPECFNPNTRTFNGLFDGNYWSKTNEDNTCTIIQYNKVIDEATSAWYAFRGAGWRWATNGLKIDDRYKFENLVNGWLMFSNQWPYGRGLYGDITMNLINLENGGSMFSCGERISSFTSPLPKLTDGNNMFRRAQIGNNILFIFNSELPMLSNGDRMFDSCQLDKDSVLRICNSIPTWTSGTHLLTLGIHINQQNDEDVLASIAAAEEKGWTLTVQWNGTSTTSSTSSTFSLRTPPIYAKLEEMETTNGEKEQYLSWGHYVTDSSSYQEFSSLEEAYEYFNLEFPKENC